VAWIERRHLARAAVYQNRARSSPACVNPSNLYTRGDTTVREEPLKRLLLLELGCLLGSRSAAREDLRLICALARVVETGAHPSGDAGVRFQYLAETQE
jgi:hypothetical protein